MIKKIIILILALSLSSMMLHAKEVKNISYKVKSGDTLSMIAQKHHVGINEIIKINDIKPNDVIKINQTLKLPITFKKNKKISKSKKLATPVSKRKNKEYKVISGDTISSVAYTHHCTTKALLNANNMGYKDLLKIGQMLTIPKASKTLDMTISEVLSAEKDKKIVKKPKKAKNIQKSSMVSYTVTKGDSLSAIARLHHTTVKKLLKLNNMKSGNLLKIGQNLKITSAVKSLKKDQSFKKKKSSKKDKSPKKSAEKNKLASVKKDASKGEYEVKSGDTLFSIARRNNVTLKELMTLNHITGSSIKIGQKLNILKKSAFIEEKKSKKKQVVENKKYKVRHGDTLAKIAKKNHISIKKLRKLNHLSRRSKLKKGMYLSLSKKSVIKIEKKISKKYKVKKGDTLWRIAKKNKITLKELRAFNHFTRKSKIHKGMLLYVAKKESGQENKKKKVKIKTKLTKYKVKHGDTLAKVAKKNHISVKELRKLNNLSRRSRLKRGMILALNRSTAKKLKATKNRKVKKSTRHTRRASNALDIFKSGGRNKGDYGIIRVAKRYLGRRYVWGATGPSSFDCSGFTQYVLRKSRGIRLPRVSRAQAYYGKYVSRRNLRAGDLIFFDTSHRRRGYVNHVGIYIGNSKFIEASSARHRVIIASLKRPFYSARFKWGRRVTR